MMIIKNLSLRITVVIDRVIEMTIKQARKILGKQARNISDNQLQRDIGVAMLLKDLFFNNVIKRRNKLAKIA